MKARQRTTRVVRRWSWALVAGTLAFGIAFAQSNYTSLLDQAHTAVPAKYEGPTTPAPAPKNIKIAAISCNSILHGCVSPVNGVRDAAAVLNWKFQSYDGGGTAAQQNKSMLNAIAWGANVIVNVAIDPNLVQQGLKAAKDAGVLVVSGSNGIDSPNPIMKPASGKLGYAFDVGPDYAALGRKLGNWMVADTKGTGDFVVFSDKEFPSVLALQRGLLEPLKGCSGCTLNALQYFTGQQVGTTLGTQTVGFLRTHPKVQFVFSPYDPAAAAQVAAIQQAGMAKDVKLTGVLGDAQNLNFIRNHQVQTADAAYDNEYMGWAIVDQVIRTLDGKALFSPHGENLPYVVLDSSNLPSPGVDWQASFDYKKQFEKLWGVQ